MITRPDKGSGIVILDKTLYKEKISKLISDVNKFKKLNEHSTLTREGQLQRILRKAKDKNKRFDKPLFKINSLSVNLNLIKNFLLLNIY